MNRPLFVGSYLQVTWWALVNDNFHSSLFFIFLRPHDIQQLPETEAQLSSEPGAYWVEKVSGAWKFPFFIVFIEL